MSEKIKEIEAEGRIDKINNFFTEIYEGDDENESLERRKEDIYQDIQEIKNKIEESSNKQDELDEYYIKIFGEFDKETEKRQGGLKIEIENRRKELTEYEELQKKIGRNA